MSKSVIVFALLVLITMSGCNSKKENTKDKTGTIPLIVGTYTKKEAHVDGKGAGIYVYAFDTVQGTITKEAVKKGIVNPSYVAASSANNLVVAVSEEPDGKVFSYQFDDEAMSLNPIDSISSFGDYPCHVAVTANGDYVYVANYGTGSIAAYAVAADLSLDVLSHYIHEGKGKTARQASAHAHMMWPNPHKEGEVFAVDLGIDQVRVYQQTDSALLFNYSIDLPAGSGPRHIAFHPKASDKAYVVNELSGTVSLLEKDSLFRFKTDYKLLDHKAQTDDAGAADIQITPDGRYLYASVRGGENLVTIFKIEASGQLTLIGRQKVGQAPRCIQLSPKGKFLLVANQDDSTIITYRIQTDGNLKEVAKTEVPTPVSLAFFK